jgi:hypothetical protein
MRHLGWSPISTSVSLAKNSTYCSKLIIIIIIIIIIIVIHHHPGRENQENLSIETVLITLKRVNFLGSQRVIEFRAQEKGKIP